MKQENKRCGSCGSFCAYYTRGYCNRHKKVTEKGESCDRWFCRRTSSEKRIRAVVNSIPEIYNKIAVIEQMLKEDCELQKMTEETDS